MKAKTLGSTSFALIALAAVGRAQCFDWEHHFDRAGSNAQVRAQVVFDDGSGPALYVGGGFTTLAGLRANYIARWNGASWSTLGEGVAGNDTLVEALAVFDDGSGPALFVGGHFTTAGGVAASNIAKWNGAQWSPLGAGITSTSSAEVRCLATYDEGTGARLFVGGEFETAGGVVTRSIASWDGASWSSPGAGNPGFGGAAGGIVHALQVYDSGAGAALYAGGSFTSINGVGAANLAAWRAGSWSSVAGVNSQVRALAVHDAGSGNALYVASWSTQRILAWNGSSLTLVGGAQVTGEPTALASFDDGVHGPRLFVGGIGGPHFQAWDGAVWSNASPTTPIQYGTVAALGVFDLGAGPRLFVGGQFDQAGIVRLDNLASYDGTSLAPMHTATSVDSRVLALASYESGNGRELFAGGRFVFAGAAFSNAVARWNPTGWSDGQLAVTQPWPAEARALATWNDGTGEKLFAGGMLDYFPNYQPVNGIAAWNGAQWSTLGNGPGLGAHVNAICVADDGTGEMLYAGGALGGSGTTTEFVARWNGTSWVPFPQPYTGNVPSSIAQFHSSTGQRVVVGCASVVSGPSSPLIQEWDGSSWSSMNAGLNGLVNAVAAFDDGSGEALYAGGSFTTAGGLAASHIARWDGSSWSAVAGGTNGYVYAFQVFDDGSGPALYVGGYFTSADGVPAQHIARWNGTQWSALGAGVDGPVTALAVHDDGSGPALFLGGDFQTSGAVVANFTAKWARACTCGPTVYCTSGVTSSGCVTSISGSGTPSASASSGFTISAANVEGQRQGHVFYGLSGPHAAPWGTSSHFLCVKAPTQRTPTQSSGGNAGACDGAIALDWNAYVAAHPGSLGTPFSAGTNVWAQLYFRDPLGPKTTALSNALAFTVCP